MTILRTDSLVFAAVLTADEAGVLAESSAVETARMVVSVTCPAGLRVACESFAFTTVYSDYARDVEETVRDAYRYLAIASDGRGAPRGSASPHSGVRPGTDDAYTNSENPMNRVSKCVLARKSTMPEGEAGGARTRVPRLYESERS